ncbi:MAG TPA: hypothetical protein DEH75_29600 [Bradyrhizobium sp.]|nr:hypothetical protein [Bradyrhizobium sp.]
MKFSRAPAVLDRIEALQHAEAPCSHSDPRRRVPFLSSILAGMRKGMISYQLRFSECEHRHASKCQHARKALCSRSCLACQEQILDQFHMTDGEPAPVTEPVAAQVPLTL